MPYSLLTAATLGFDLVRRPGGHLVAQMLLVALNADVPMLTALADAHPDAGRPSRRYAISSRRAREAAAAADRPSAVPAGARRPLGVWKARMAQEPIGGVQAIERLLRCDILGRDQAAPAEPGVLEVATEVLVNAVLGAWAADRLSVGDYDETTTPYLRAVAAVDPSYAPALGPDSNQVLAVVASPVQRGRLIADRWAARATHLPRSSAWAEAMHRACWAAHLSGRIRTIAAAHLLAVQTFRHADLGVPELRGGLWNLFAGSIQATSVADLLDERTVDELAGPWRLLAA